MNRPSTCGCGDQLGGVAGIDAAAVEHRRRGRQDRRGDALDQRLPRVGIVGGRRDALLADRPDRLVGEQDRRGALLARRGTRSAPSVCAASTSSARPDSRSASVSPTQISGTRPWRTAASVLRPTVSSVSPKCSRRSLWPSSIRSRPQSVELQRRDLAGPGAGVGPVHVLRADLDPGRGERRA